jgi:divalent metal cation (Fe/Co/Zn/Cd) transporter
LNVGLQYDGNKSSWTDSCRICQELSDGAHKESQQQAQTIVESMHDEDVLAITSIRARQVGSAVVAEVTVEIASDLTTTATRAVEERIQRSFQRQLSKGGRTVVATAHAKPI